MCNNNLEHIFIETLCKKAAYKMTPPQQPRSQYFMTLEHQKYLQIEALIKFILYDLFFPISFFYDYISSSQLICAHLFLSRR